MSEHTPGPWNTMHPWDEVWADSDESGIHICHPAPIEANARLIAAAPALLEACQAIADRLDYLSELWGQEGVTRSLMDQVRSALALAKKGDE